MEINSTTKEAPMFQTSTPDPYFLFKIENAINLNDAADIRTYGKLLGLSDDDINKLIQDAADFQAENQVAGTYGVQLSKDQAQLTTDQNQLNSDQSQLNTDTSALATLTSQYQWIQSTLQTEYELYKAVGDTSDMDNAEEQMQISSAQYSTSSATQNEKIAKDNAVILTDTTTISADKANIQDDQNLVDAATTQISVTETAMQIILKLV